MRGAHTAIANGPMNPPVLFSLKINIQRFKRLALSFCVISIPIVLGLGLLWERDKAMPEESPEYSLAIASPSERAFSSPPEGNILSSSKVPSSTQKIPSQKDSQDVAGYSKPQSRGQSVADAKQTVISPPSVSQTTPFKKKKGFVAKTPISQTAHKGVNSHRGPAPQRIHILDDLERLNQGSSLVRNRSYLKAIHVLEPLFTNPPEEWEPWFWMGTAQMGAGRYEKAGTYFKNGLARDETIPELWVQCALAEHLRGQYSQALNLLHQAELLAPTLPQVHLNLALTLESQGNTRSALRHYRQYLSLTNRNRSYFATRQKVLERILNLEES